MRKIKNFSFADRMQKEVYFNRTFYTGITGTIKCAYSRNKQLQLWSFAAVFLLMTLCMMTSFYPLRPSSDFFFHYNRLYIIVQAIENGTLPFYMDNNVLDGYGYFTKAFYPDLLLLPFAAIGYFAGIYTAYLSLIFTMTYLCGLFTYIVMNKIYRSAFAAAVGSILFSFAAYRLHDLYFRCALGESISFTWMPLVLWGVYEIVKGDYKKWYILTLACFLLINTHVISTIIIFIVTLFFLAFNYSAFVKEPARLKYLALSGITALIISSYFVFPLLEQLFSNRFWMSSKPFFDGEMGLNWRYTVYAIFTSFNHDSNVSIGGILIAMACLRFFINGRNLPQLKSLDFGVLLACICLLLCYYRFWNILPSSFTHIIQFPWRFFPAATFLLSVAGGVYASQLLAKSRIYRKILFFLFIAAVSYYGMGYGMDGLYKQDIRTAPAVTADFPKTVVGAEYLPEKVPSLSYLKERGFVVSYRRSDTETGCLQRQDNGLSFSLKTAQKDAFELPLIYYKGYRAELNGEEIEVGESKNGLLEITAAKSGEVKVYYAGTAIQKISVWLTLLSLLALLGYIFARAFLRKQ
jgi:hypothetical protein